MGRKVELDVAQRCEAVMALLRREEPAAAIARRHGICEATLYRLRDEFLAAGKEALSQGRGDGKKREDRLARLDKALAERDRVIGELTIANRILKKVEEGLL
jgi:transposase-like protein